MNLPVGCIDPILKIDVISVDFVSYAPCIVIDFKKHYMSGTFSNDRSIYQPNEFKIYTRMAGSLDAYFFIYIPTEGRP